METNYILDQLTHISKVNPNGFTYDFAKETFIKNGFIVAYEGTQDSHTIDCLPSIIETAKEQNCIICGWLDTETDKYYFDSCKVFDDAEDAIDFGKANNQIAICDANRKEEIRLS